MMKGLLNERGQTTVEFGFVLVLIVVAAIVALGGLGSAVLQLWNGVVSVWPT
jgi:Flp pilus assembly pilin Flp